MFSKREKISEKKEHFHKPFKRISLSTNPSDMTRVLALEEKRGIYLFENLSTFEEKELDKALDLFEKSYDQCEKIIMDFLVLRYRASEKDAKEIRQLAENNSRYKRALEQHIQFETDEPARKKQKLDSYDPEKRKQLTIICREAEGIPHLFALDEQLEEADLSELYDDTSDEEPAGDTEKQSLGNGDDDVVPLAFSKRPNPVTFFQPEEPSKETKASQLDDGSLTPLNTRKVGGMLAWDSLQKMPVTSTVHPPFVSPAVSQETVETTSPQRKRKRE